MGPWFWKEMVSPPCSAGVLTTEGVTLTWCCRYSRGMVNRPITPVGTETGGVRVFPRDEQFHLEPCPPPDSKSPPCPSQPSQLTQNEKRQTIEDGTHEGQDVEEEGQLGVKVRVSRAHREFPPTCEFTQQSPSHPLAVQR